MRSNEYKPWGAGPFWYEAPFFACGVQAEDTTIPVGCSSAASLPYDNLPRTDHEKFFSDEPTQLALPSDDWKVFYGCVDCGLVSVRGKEHIFPDIVHKQTEGSFRNDVTLCYVEFPCADTKCKAPTKMMIDKDRYTEEDVLKLMKSIHFHGSLPCGHAIKPVPSSLCKIQPINSKLW